MSHSIEIDSGKTVRLLTGGKYCADNIEVTAIPEDLSDPMAEQAALIEQIRTALRGKMAIAPIGEPGLPTGYWRCGYIRFNGEQAVDTGIVPTQDIEIRAQFIRGGESAYYLYGVIGQEGGTHVSSITAYCSSGGAWRFGSRSINRNIVIDPYTVNNSIQSKGGVRSSGTTTTYSTVDAFESPGTLILGGVRQAGGYIDAQFVGAVLDWEIYMGGELVQKLIPVTNGEAWRFWDAVENKFHDSATTTALEGGYL